MGEEEVVEEEAGELPSNVTGPGDSRLTGNPQIDYVHDPNLPQELNGYNLSSYPFHTRVPANINFSCTGLKEGFYANVEHKCQVDYNNSRLLANSCQLPSHYHREYLFM